MSIATASLLGLVFAIAATAVLYIFIMPQKRLGKLSPFFLALHNILHFKKLFVERILKFFYIFSTCVSIFWGFFLLFAQNETSSYGYFYDSYVSYESTLVEGLVFLFLGPIMLRVVYELLMILILATKNIMELNHKMDAVTKTIAPDINTNPEPRMLYCTQCGTHYDANAGKCPNCGEE